MESKKSENIRSHVRATYESESKTITKLLKADHLWNWSAFKKCFWDPDVCQKSTPGILGPSEFEHHTWHEDEKILKGRKIALENEEELRNSKEE